MWKSEFRQNYYRTSFSPTVPPFAARISRVVADGGTWRLKWEPVKAGESNGKLLPRTCPGCNVPESYRSHDWALVRAKPGLQGWILMNEYCSILTDSPLQDSSPTESSLSTQFSFVRSFQQTSFANYILHGARRLAQWHLTLVSPVRVSFERPTKLSSFVVRATRCVWTPRAR